MTKKNWILILIVVALAIVYLINFTDWFQPKSIQIYHTFRPLPPQRQNSRRMQTVFAKTTPVLFSFNQKFKLTEIKVFAASDVETNQYPVPIWHLISDSNSIPLNWLIYGSGVRGMRPATKGKGPEPLVPNVSYRLVVTAGKLTGEHDFKPGPKPPDRR